MITKVTNISLEPARVHLVRRVDGNLSDEMYTLDLAGGEVVQYDGDFTVCTDTPRIPDLRVDRYS